MAISRAAQMVTLHLVCKYNNTSFPPKNQSRFGYIQQLRNRLKRERSRNINTQNAESSNKIVTNAAKIEDSNHHIFFLPFVSYQDINGNYELSLRYFDFDFMLGAKTLITPYPKTMLDISNGYKINI